MKTDPGVDRVHLCMIYCSSEVIYVETRNFDQSNTLCLNVSLVSLPSKSATTERSFLGMNPVVENDGQIGRNEEYEYPKILL